jgi:hypothetical protein
MYLIFFKEVPKVGGAHLLSQSDLLKVHSDVALLWIVIWDYDPNIY